MAKKKATKTIKEPKEPLVDEENTEVINKVSKAAGERRTHKYLCPACTNEAFYLTTGIKTVPSIVKCPICGKETPYDESRLVKL